MAAPLRFAPALAVLLLGASPFAMAQDVWKPMAVEALAGLRLNYGEAWQEFRPSGRTLYNAGEDSWGYWREEGGRYCSQWPPRDVWACYDLERRGNDIRFIDDGGRATQGQIE